MKRKKTSSISTATAPIKGILKPEASRSNPTAAINGNGRRPQQQAQNNEPTSTSVTNSQRKRATFDEANVVETFHPRDKTYGHMKIDEPDTPFEPSEQKRSDEKSRPVNAAELNRKLMAIKQQEEEGAAEEPPAKDFEQRRREHYNEFKKAKSMEKDKTDEN